MLVEMKGGEKRDIHPKVAAILIQQGHVREIGQAYQTRDMRAAVLTDQLAGLAIEALRELASKRGIKFHHRTGEAKLRELLK